MSSVPYFPLIGLDKNGNEHPKEWPGKSPEDAAENLAAKYGYVEVKSGVSSLKQGKNGGGNYYRKSLFKEANGSSGPASPLAQELTAQLEREAVKKIQPLLDNLRGRGITFTVIETKRANGTVKKSVLINPVPLICNVTIKELGGIKDKIRENMDPFIKAIEQDSAPAESAPTPGADPLKGKTQREIVLSLLPQMPSPFSIDDFLERLKAAGYEQLADQRERMQNALVYCVQKAEVIRHGRATFEVVEEFRHRRANGEARKDTPVIEPTVQPVPIAPVVVTPLIQQPEPELTKPAPQATAVTMPASPAAFSAQLASTVLDLVTQAATSDEDDTGDLAGKLHEACQQFETTMLEAVAALTATVQPVVERLNKRAAARQILIRSLTNRPPEDG
jgi:hypothetical protein